MALSVGVQKVNSNAVNGFFRRFSHVIAITPSFHNLFHPISSPSLSLPEPETETETGFHPQLPTFSSHLGSLDLMAVPKKKISKHKRGIRNGPKALKPIPVIVRCK
ncbi:hypothetical protein KSS87_009388 [Heliosperma pusillum]|nr:hypothetical protein KSS87_009388 [Heliosperma pusillum]